MYLSPCTCRSRYNSRVSVWNCECGYVVVGSKLVCRCKLRPRVPSSSKSPAAFVCRPWRRPARWQPWHSSVHCRNYTPQCHYRFAYDRNALNGRGEGRGRAGRAPAAAQSVRAGPRAAPLTPRSPPSNSPVQCKCLWFYGVHITTTVVVGCDRGGGRRCVLVVLFSAHVLAREMFTRPTHALCLLACRSTA